MTNDQGIFFMNDISSHTPGIIRWEAIQEAREGYFVEHLLASDHVSLATLVLVFINPQPAQKEFAELKAGSARGTG